MSDLKYEKLLEENKKLKSELHCKEDLIQQLKIALDTDDYRLHHEYRRKYIAVCEDLADMNKDYKDLLDENKSLKVSYDMLYAQIVGIKEKCDIVVNLQENKLNFS